MDSLAMGSARQIDVALKPVDAFYDDHPEKMDWDS